MNSFIKQNNNANTSRVGLEPIFFHSPNYTGGKIKDQPTLTAYKTRPNTPNNGSCYNLCTQKTWNNYVTGELFQMFRVRLALLRGCLVSVFKHTFEYFKQYYYIYFHTLFHPHVY